MGGVVGAACGVAGELPAAQAGEAVQVVAREVVLPWREVDLSGLAEDEALAEVERLAGVERGKRFDLSVAPLLRLLLVRLGGAGTGWC